MLFRIHTRLLLGIILTCAVTGVACAEKAASKPDSPVEPIKLLILTGANNHDWQATTQVLETIFANSDHFTVTLELNPERMSSASLAKYDVLVSNWNSFGKSKPPPWPKEAKEAYVNFVRKGGGHVVLHAGSSSYYDWPDYQNIGLANWGKGTDHGAVHDFELRIADKAHPITAGLSKFTTTDELWRNPYVTPNSQVIAEAYSKVTEKWEPSVFVGKFGKGRCFTILLGHDANSMRNPNFQKLLRQGSKWAGKAK